MIAPIILFAYKRPVELESTIKALKANHLAAKSELYIFVDGPKKPDDIPKVQQVQKLLDRVTGFKAIYRHYSPHNIGCADSVIQGITYVLDRHPAAIVVEDDIVTSPNFLDYMNQCLTYYESNLNIYSIAGFTFPFQLPPNYPYSSYFVPRHSPWGWATWRNRWQRIDWEMEDYSLFRKDRMQQQAFNQGGSDLVGMLQRQMEGKADAWDIRFCYNRFKANALTVYPTLSKVQNIGFGQEATHTDIYNRYKTTIDPGLQRNFHLSNEMQSTPYYHNLTLDQYSVPRRIYNKLKTYIGMR